MEPMEVSCMIVYVDLPSYIYSFIYEYKGVIILVINKNSNLLVQEL